MISHARSTIGKFMVPTGPIGCRSIFVCVHRIWDVVVLNMSFGILYDPGESQSILPDSNSGKI